MGISLTQLLIILAVVILLFGTKRLRNIGSDLGSAIKGFKQSMSDGEKDAAKDAPTDPAKPSLTQEQKPGARIIDQTAQSQDEKKS